MVQPHLKIARLCFISQSSKGHLVNIRKMSTLKAPSVLPVLVSFIMVFAKSLSLDFSSLVSLETGLQVG